MYAFGFYALSNILLFCTTSVNYIYFRVVSSIAAMTQQQEEKKMINGTIINTTTIPIPVWCEKCHQEIEEEAIIVGDKPYHYKCSGIEL